MTRQQIEDRNQASTVIKAVVVLALAGFAFTGFFLDRIAGDYKAFAAAGESHGDDHAAPADAHGAPVHDDPSTHAEPAHSATEETPAAPTEGAEVTFTEPTPTTAFEGRRVRLAGTARPGDLVRLSSGGKEIAEVKADEEGHWEHEWTAAEAGAQVVATSLGNGSKATLKLAGP